MFQLLFCLCGWLRFSFILIRCLTFQYDVIHKFLLKLKVFFVRVDLFMLFLCLHLCFFCHFILLINCRWLYYCKWLFYACFLLHYRLCHFNLRFLLLCDIFIYGDLLFFCLKFWFCLFYLLCRLLCLFWNVFIRNSLLFSFPFLCFLFSFHLFVHLRNFLNLNFNRALIEIQLINKFKLRYFSNLKWTLSIIRKWKYWLTF